MSAFVCEPGTGSEPGAAWTWAAAAATRHDVWLVTDPRNELAVETQLVANPDLRLTPVYLRLPKWTGGTWQSTPGLRNRYVVWQWQLGRAVGELERRAGFDIAHHLTIGADWLPAGIAAIEGVPLVWGPVGGAAPALPALWRKLGPAFAAGELARMAITGTARSTIGRHIARRADLVVAQNSVVARRFERWADVTVAQNIALTDDDVAATGAVRPGDSRNDRRRRAVFVGRLLPWKGLRLALEAMTRPGVEQWDLDVIGTGRERAAAEQFVAAHGLADRVRFAGHVPRDDVLAALGAADALLFPSMHDAAGWVVAEALAVGCPVVCLDVTGPAELVTPGTGVRVPPHGDVVGGLASALSSLQGRIDPVHAWDARRAPDLLDHWYEMAIANHERSVGAWSAGQHDERGLGHDGSASATPPEPLGVSAR